MKKKEKSVQTKKGRSEAVQESAAGYFDRMLREKKKSRDMEKAAYFTSGRVKKENQKIR